MPSADEIRPNIFNDVLGQDHIVKRLNQMVESNNFNWPHMMFAGPAGVGTLKDLGGQPVSIHS